MQTYSTFFHELEPGTPSAPALPIARQKGFKWRARFGPFTLTPSERLLQRDGISLRLGGRAFDILVALVSSAGEIVSKRDLMAQVWPDMIVEEGSLRFHMVAIRKALGDGVDGNRYIVNAASKGYVFVARVERQAMTAPMPELRPRSAASLPAPAAPMVGRDKEVEAVIDFLLRRRMVSVVGIGGIGKTTVAIAAAQLAAQHFDADVHFIDLSTIASGGLVCAALANAVGLQNSIEDLAALEAHLAARKALIVLDCCEHVIDEVAKLAEVLVNGCPQISILATSREPLRAAGEYVYRLPPLSFPAERSALSAEAALGYPAIRLLVDRTAACGSGFELDEGNVALAVELCRRLGGIALAIELAASRVEALGLKTVTSQFDAGTSLKWNGRRTAIPRHQTLAAALDWSFNLLSGAERILLQRLSIFAGKFSLDAAIAICGFDYESAAATDVIADLVGKSLISVDAGGVLRYGMLDSTKSYCRAKLAASNEEACLLQRFASYYGDWVGRYRVPPKEEDCEFILELPNLRSALEQYLKDEGSAVEASHFAAAFCPLLLQFSQIAECARWAQAALARLPVDLNGSVYELRLQGAVGQSLMFAKGSHDGVAPKAFRRAIEIAEQLGDIPAMLHLTNGYAVLLHREGAYTEALSLACKAQSLVGKLDNAEFHAIVDSLMGVCLHMVGKVGEAIGHWERSVASTADVSSELRSKLGFDFYIRALCGLARSLWLTGSYSKGMAMADEALSKARERGHAVTRCIAMIWGGSVFVFARDLPKLEALADELEQVARSHSLEPYIHVANVLRGQWFILSGQPAKGVQLIRSAIDGLHACRYEMVTSSALIFMAGGLSDMALHSASIAACTEAEKNIRAGGDFLRMPQLLITRGRCLAAAGKLDEAEESYRAALRLAHEQGVKSSAVEVAVVLAKLLISEERDGETENLLRPYVIEAASETSVDLEEARSLLPGAQ